MIGLGAPWAFYYAGSVKEKKLVCLILILTNSCTSIKIPVCSFEHGWPIGRSITKPFTKLTLSADCIQISIKETLFSPLRGLTDLAARRGEGYVISDRLKVSSAALGPVNIHTYVLIRLERLAPAGLSQRHCSQVTFRL